MNDDDDHDIPVVHAGFFTLVLIICVLALLFLLTACAATPQTVTVKVPVPVECREEVPDRPAMPTEEFRAKPSLDQWTRALEAENKTREGYEIKLRAALEACTAPITKD